MSVRQLGLILALLATCCSSHTSYQVPPSGAPRVDTYNSVPIRQKEQTYGTPPPRTYSSPPPASPIQEPRYETPAPIYEAPRTYSTPQPIQEQPKVYETPPPACPNGGRRHPATGECLVNECETGQHDCDRNAKCIDTFESYTCACQSGYIDESPSLEKPGRTCSLPEVSNNCGSGRSGCSPDAICTDTYNGVACKCKLGYVDLSENPRTKPGQRCQKNVDECASPSLNTCSKDADCHDTFDSYYCVCKEGFKDVDPSNAGRECEKIESAPCSDSSKNDCHVNAICTNKKPDGYTCRCKDGFSDKSTDPLRPGRICEEIPRCGQNSDCDPSATCTNTADGYVCTCPAGSMDTSPEKETKPGRKCEKVIETQIPLVIVQDGSNPTPYSSKYSNINNKPAAEIIEIFTKDLGTTVLDTRYGPAYINTTVTKLSSPKSVQPQVDDGLIINSTIITAASAGPVNACALFDAVVEKIQANGGFVGSGTLKVGDDVQKLNPCPKPLCGGKICNAALGEVCINGVCMIDYCLDLACPINSTCINTPDSAKCVCKVGFIDIRNVSISLRLAAGYNEDQYCLRDFDRCALGLHNCSEQATCIPLRGGYTCRCNNGTIDNNPQEPGRVCILGAAEALVSPSTIPWWLMLLLALLFLLLTLCCCLWALSRLRWFKRRGIMDQSSSYSDLVIPRPKVRGMDAESMGSGSSEFTIREEIERRVVTDVTRTELHTQETEEEANEHETYTHTQSVNNERTIR